MALIAKSDGQIECKRRRRCRREGSALLDSMTLQTVCGSRAPVLNLDVGPSLSIVRFVRVFGSEVTRVRNASVQVLSVSV